MDAKGIKDGTIVAIKYRYLGNEEVRIGRMLSAAEHRQDPMNHCVPILEHFTDDDTGLNFLVMPLLRAFDDPPFYYVDEVLDFMRQTLEVSVKVDKGRLLTNRLDWQGMLYMHNQGVAHR